MLAVLSAAVATSSGLFGVVVRAPTMPVCIAGRPCSAPAADLLLSFRRGGAVRTVRTDGHGRYRIALAPGLYAVTAVTKPGPGRGLEPREVRVPAGRTVRANFTLDTGIR